MQPPAPQKLLAEVITQLKRLAESSPRCRQHGALAAFAPISASALLNKSNGSDPALELGPPSSTAPPAFPCTAREMKTPRESCKTPEADSPIPNTSGTAGGQAGKAGAEQRAGKEKSSALVWRAACHFWPARAAAGRDLAVPPPPPAAQLLPLRPQESSLLPGQGWRGRKSTAKRAELPPTRSGCASQPLHHQLRAGSARPERFIPCSEGAAPHATAQEPAQGRAVTALRFM